MASLDEYLASRQCLWDKASSSGNEFISISEVWQAKSPESDHHTLHRTLRNHELPAWLEDTNNSHPIDAGSKGKTRVLRLVWIPHDKRSGANDVGDGILELLTHSFDHTLAEARLRATFHGFGSVVEPSTGRRSFYFCKHPHLAVTWSQDPTSGVTSVICVARLQQVNVFRDLVSGRFIQALAAVAHVPALMCFIMCSRELDGVMRNIKQQIRQTEVRTGHHRFESRVEPPATGELLWLSAEMSGCLSKLANATRKLGIMHGLERFTVEEVAKLRKGAKSARDAAIIKEFLTHVKSIRQHSILQKLDTECLVCRAQIQQDAIKHLITSVDTITSQELGKDAKSVAILAKKDSGSMKALALIATFFIPPSFVSSLLSIPLFDLESADDKSSVQTAMSWGERLLLYLSITGPLMVVTFSIWGLLVHGRSLRRKEKRPPDNVEQHDSSHGSEVMSLLARRTMDSRSSWNGE